MKTKLPRLKTMIQSLCIVLALICTFLFSTGYFYIASPWKPIHPNDEGFKIEEFRLTDYANDKELREVLSMLFPVGTSKPNVDRIINSAGNVEIERHITNHIPDKGKIIYRYGYYSNIRQMLPMLFLVPGPPPPAYRVLIEYDEEMRLKSITHVRTIGLEWPFKKN